MQAFYGRAGLAITVICALVLVTACRRGGNDDDSYTVNYYLQEGGTAYESQSVASGDTVEGLPADPSMDGYSFAGWYTKPDGGGSQFSASTIVSSDLSLYAAWDPIISYSVTYYLEEGSTAYQSQSVASGDTVESLPTDPSMDGYSFAGWYTEPDGGGSQFSASTIVSSDISLYAAWDPIISYSVTYYLEEGAAAYQSQSVVSGDTVESLPSDPSKKGYGFVGWYTKPDGKGSKFSASTVVGADLSLYAAWSLVSYAISYHLNGGKNSAANPASYTLKSAAIVFSDPSKAGYTFSGWYSDSGFVTKIKGIAAGSTGAVSLYAKYLADNGISVTVSIPGDGSLNFSASDIVVVKGDDLTVSIVEPDYVSYAWYVDGTESGTGRALSLSTSDLSIGLHSLMIVVTDSSGTSSSGSCSFTVQN